MSNYLNINKRLIFAFRQPYKEEMAVLNNNNSIILALNTLALIGLEKLNIPYFTLRDYFDKKEYEDCFEQLIVLINDLGELKIDNKYTLREFLIYKDLSLWDLCQTHLSFEIFNYFYFCKIIKKTIENEKPKHIIILSGAENNLVAIIKSIAWLNGISFSVLYPSFLFRLKNTHNLLFNFFITRPHPFIDLLKRWPPSFIYIEKLKNFKEKLFLSKNSDLNYSNPVSTQKKKKILIISFNFYRQFIKSVVNILNELNKNKENLVMVIRADIVSEDFKKLCRKLGIRYKTYTDYLSKDAELRLEDIMKIFLKKLRSINSFNIFGYLTGILGTSSKIFLQHFFKIHFSRFSLIRLTRFRLVVESIIEKEKPDIIIIQEERTKFGQIIAKQANQRHIPCLVILPYLLDYDPFWNFFIRVPSNADMCAVTTASIRNCLIKYGTPSEKIAVVGNPITEKLLKTNLMSKEDVYSRLKIDNKKSLFVFSSQPLTASNTVHRILIEMMENFPNKHLVIKLHPEEASLRDALSIKRAKLKNVSVIKEFDFWSLINASELFITISSASALEAIMLRKPVVVVGLSSFPDRNYYLERCMDHFVDYGVAVGIYKYNDLVPTINKVLNHTYTRERLFKNIDRFIADNLSLADGLASKRIFSLINENISK